MNNRIFTVVAPLAGTFYVSPSPDELPYAEVGQEVNSGDVVCIIESMKVFTELRTDQGGIVTKILVADEDPVMKDQEVMEIEMV